nr:MAG TPA: hypothetical protein [Caudoviricetes sp.]
MRRKERLPSQCNTGRNRKIFKGRLIPLKIYILNQVCKQNRR